jgi:tRNA A-37 threonylcarbamoyl transferase component Bud32
MDKIKLFLYRSEYQYIEDICKYIGIKIISNNKNELINKILICFKEYDEFKTKNLNKYVICNQIGNKGKEGITFLVKFRNKEYAMKRFNKKKSSINIQKEATLQIKASTSGISPKIIDVDIVNNFIVMEKMDKHLIDLIKENNGCLSDNYQKQIINIFMKLDQCKVFHADSNLINYMLKDDKIYIIDFGMSKLIDDKLIKKLNTNTPNLEFMNLGFILKLKEFKFNSSSFKVLLSFVSNSNRMKYGL